MNYIKRITINFFLFMLFVTGTFAYSISGKIKEKPLVAIVCSYNNIKWAKKNLDTIFFQRYKNYRVIYIDDCSTDGTAEFVEDYIKQHNLTDKVTFIRNKKRLRKLANVYRAIHLCEDDEIVVMIDGDDWLASRGVFAFINQEYADKNVWFTYGQYRNEPAQEAEKWGFSAKGYCKPVSRRLQKRKIYRSRQFVYMHVRTFYAWLFKLIKLEDLIAMKVQGFEGDFYPASNDLAMYYPIAEMANKRVRFISKVLYIRNLFSDIVGFKVDSKLQHAASTEIRKKQLYAQRTRPAKSRINKFQQAKADLFLFCSKRDVIEADAIYHIMEQIKGVNTIYVFYVDSIENNKKIKELQQSFSSVQFISYNPNKAMAFKESILEQLDNSPSDHILLLTDKIIITEPIDMQELIQWLEQTFALAFYLDRGEEEKGVPRHVELNDTICAWKFTISKGKWKSMYRVNGALYRKWNLKKKLEDGEFCTLANLKQQLKKNEPDSKKMGLFYKKRRVRLNDGK